MTNKQMIKRPNRQITRRLDGLVSKLLKYGELEGIELVFVVRNTKKDEIYSYLSSHNIDWIGQIEQMRDHPRTKNDFPEQIRERQERLALSTKGVKKREHGKPRDAARLSEEIILPEMSPRLVPTFPELKLTLLRRVLNH